MITAIVSDKLTETVEEQSLESYLPEEIEFYTWSNFNPGRIIAEHLVIDLDLTQYIDGVERTDIPISSGFEGKIRDLPEVDHKHETLLATFQTLAEVVPDYLDAGNHLTVIYADMVVVQSPENEQDWVQTHYWLIQRDLLTRTWPVDQAKFQDNGISEFEVLTDSQPIEEYFKFVEGYTHLLNFEDNNLDNPEILAKNSEENPIAVAFNEYGRFRQHNAEPQKVDGTITFLPQPTKLQPNPQNLITALANIGSEEASPDADIPTAGSPDRSGTLQPVATATLKQTLQNTKYGQEVLDHIADGDICLEENLYQPALGAYIHAIEWAIITYLEDQHGHDIIQDEQQDGTYYNLAGGQHDLLDKLTNHTTLDQKTESKIRSMNRAERRWMAHHKSGNTLYHDVMGIRSRLLTILNDLFA